MPPSTNSEVMLSPIQLVRGRQSTFAPFPILPGKRTILYCHKRYFWYVREGALSFLKAVPPHKAEKPHVPAFGNLISIELGS